MPSPFPGMDPYLEGEMWQEFHSTLANEMRGRLLKILPEKYTALLHKRFELVEAAPEIFAPSASAEGRATYPDVSVVESQRQLSEVRAAYAGANITAPAAELVSPMLEETPILRIEIRDVAHRQLVTVIEILSPANKIGKGAQTYFDKRAELLTSRVHLLEIDLIRRGQRIPLQGEWPTADYYAFLSRGERRPLTQVWPIQLRDPLPRLPVPLLPPDEDVVLNLNAAVKTCFELVRYETLLDYAAAPPLPQLSDEDAAWVAERIAAFRKTAVS